MADANMPRYGALAALRAPPLRSRLGTAKAIRRAPAHAPRRTLDQRSGARFAAFLTDNLRVWDGVRNRRLFPCRIARYSSLVCGEAKPPHRLACAAAWLQGGAIRGCVCSFLATPSGTSEHSSVGRRKGVKVFGCSDEGAQIPYASASSASPSAWAAKPTKPVSPSVALDAAARRPH